MKELDSWLEGLLEAGESDGKLLVTGDRGVGKSIFTHAVAKAFAARHRDRVVLLEVDCRGKRAQAFFPAVARELAAVGYETARYAGKDPLLPWLTHLKLLATRPRITRTSVENVSQSQSVGVGIRAGLFGALEARGGVEWEHRKELGQTVEMTLEVTDDLIERALGQCLQQLSDEGLLVVVLFDDLDQALLPGEPDQAVEALQHTLSIEPCVRLVHLRTEMLHRDIKREIEDFVELAPMRPDQLMEVVEKRLLSSPESLREKVGGVPEVWSAFRAFSRVVGKPRVFLQWCYGLLRTREFPGDWELGGDDTRRLIALKVGYQGQDFESVRRLVKHFERVSGGDAWCRREQLLQAEGAEEGSGLSEEELAALDRLGLLQPSNRFEDDPKLRLDPVLRILLVELSVVEGEE